MQNDDYILKRRKFAEVLDGSNTAPRQCQLDYFDHLESVWETVDVQAACASPGFGKSYIARTIQRTIPNTAILTVNNVLVDQYCSTYSELIAVKGKDYYEDPKEYRQARIHAVSQPAVFNPLSFYYFHLRNKKVAPFPTTIVIDEAHGLGELLLLTISKALPCKFYGIPDGLSDREFYNWLTVLIQKLDALADTSLESNPKLSQVYETLKILHVYLADNLNKVKISYEMRENFHGKLVKHLVVQPLVIPTDLIRTIFRGAKLVLLSGTLTTFHLNELFPGKVVDFVNYEPLAPKENRPIYVKPLPLEHRRNPEAIAKTILALYEASGRPNTLVHMSYSMSEQLKPYLPKSVLLHTAQDKSSALALFKKKGGILIACGMAEGVDLPGDLCRLIIIPLILFPNKGDQAVIKRLALANGNEWYGITAMMTTVQQIGRGVRSATDSCQTVILDHYFQSLVTQTAKHLTVGLKESISYE